MCLLTMPLPQFQEWKKSRFCILVKPHFAFVVVAYLFNSLGPLQKDALSFVCEAEGECAWCAHSNRTHIKWFSFILAIGKRVREIDNKLLTVFNEILIGLLHLSEPYTFSVKLKLYVQHTYTNKPHTFRERHVVHICTPVSWAPLLQCHPTAIPMRFIPNTKIFSLRCHFESYRIAHYYHY